jgi:hypothetical protein
LSQKQVVVVENSLPVGYVVGDVFVAPQSYQAYQMCKWNDLLSALVLWSYYDHSQPVMFFLFYGAQHGCTVELDSIL